MCTLSVTERAPAAIQHDPEPHNMQTFKYAAFIDRQSNIGSRLVICHSPSELINAAASCPNGKPLCSKLYTKEQP